MTEVGGTNGAEVREPDVGELKARLGIKNNHLRELQDENAALRLAADEARAAREAGDEHVRARDGEVAELRRRVRELEDGQRGRRRRRDELERRISRLERELGRRDEEIAHRDRLLRRKEEELRSLGAETAGQLGRKDEALGDALRRVEGLEKDLEDREAEVAELEATVEDLRAELEAEYALRGRLAEPENRLRAGIDLFNDSKHRGSMNSLSRTLGQPEVHVGLGDGEEPPVLLQFTWRGISWQTYAANPGLAVEEPRVYLESAGEDLSGVDRDPPNARVGAGGRVLLGL